MAPPRGRSSWCSAITHHSGDDLLTRICPDIVIILGTGSGHLATELHWFWREGLLYQIFQLSSNRPPSSWGRSRVIAVSAYMLTILWPAFKALMSLTNSSTSAKARRPGCWGWREETWRWPRPWQWSGTGSWGRSCPWWWICRTRHTRPTQCHQASWSRWAWQSCTAPNPRLSSQPSLSWVSSLPHYPPQQFLPHHLIRRLRDPPGHQPQPGGSRSCQ